MWSKDFTMAPRYKTRASKIEATGNYYSAQFDKLFNRAIQSRDGLPHKVVSTLSLDVFQDGYLGEI